MAGETVIGRDPEKTVNAKITAKISPVFTSNIDFFQSRVTAFRISTQTQTLIPAKAFLTTCRSAKLLRHSAIIVIRIIGIVIKPSVAARAPAAPFLLSPMNVETFTAIIPGVH